MAGKNHKVLYLTLIQTASLTRISCWRPLFRPIEDSPIAFCDPSTVSAANLLATDRVAAGSYLEIYSVRYNPGQKWYWLSRQRPDEMAIFVVFDSHPPDGELNC
jgi:hypothetical protein